MYSHHKEHKASEDPVRLTHAVSAQYVDILCTALFIVLSSVMKYKKYNYGILVIVNSQHSYRLIHQRDLGCTG